MSSLSIEYAHIYSNSRINEEHETSLRILEEVKSEVLDDKISLVVMVDDYSFPDPSFDYDLFTSWLKKHGHGADLLIRESQLIPLCDQVIGLVNDEAMKREISDYIKSKKYPCSLFIATWYLLRLGYISADIYPEKLVAVKLLNILPESFKPFEDKGLEIISSTKFSEAVGKIEYRFFKGRLIG